MTNGWRFLSNGSNVLGQTFNYQFDDIGNRRIAQTGGNHLGEDLRTATYSANLLNQYTNRTVPGEIEVSGAAEETAFVTVNGNPAVRQNEYFHHELLADNSTGATSVWLTATATNSAATNLVARLEHLPQTPESFTNDADGNLTSDGLRTYTWDAENRLLAVEIQTNVVTDARHWLRVTFDYDHQHRRIRKRAWKWNPAGETYYLSTSHRFFYDDWNLIGQIDEVIGDRMSFLWGADLSGSLRGAGGVGGLVAVVVHSGVQPGSYFSNYDHNGNVVALIDSQSGSEAARYEYGPFGEEIRATGILAKENPFRFSTKFSDDNTGLLYYGYRYYNTQTGQWLSRDPLEELGGIHLYGFVQNNPLIHFDPLGLILFENSESSLLVFVGLMYDPRNANSNAKLGAYYAKGLAIGAYEGVKGTLQALAHPIETLKALEALSNLTFDQLRCLLGSKYHEFMTASPERQAQMIGEIFGNIEAGILMEAGAARAIGKLKNLPDGFDTGRLNPLNYRVPAGELYAVVPRFKYVKPAAAKSVAPGDRGLYGGLKRQKKAYGETEPLHMDHRPSFAAQKAAEEARLGRALSTEEIRILRNTTPAVATPAKIHRQKSRTYGGRNSSNQIREDAADLGAAAAKDDAAYY